MQTGFSKFACAHEFVSEPVCLCAYCGAPTLRIITYTQHTHTLARTHVGTQVTVTSATAQ